MLDRQGPACSKYANYIYMYAFFPSSGRQYLYGFKYSKGNASICLFITASIVTAGCFDQCSDCLKKITVQCLIGLCKKNTAQSICHQEIDILCGCPSIWSIKTEKW